MPSRGGRRCLSGNIWRSYAGMARLPTGRILVLQFVYLAAAVLVDWAVYGKTRSVSPMLVWP